MIASIAHIVSDKKQLLQLRNFSRSPFSDYSSEFVSDQVPSLEAAYKSAGNVWKAIPVGARLTSLAKCPGTVFAFELCLHGKSFDIAPETLTQQVLMIEEWLRDALDPSCTSSAASTLRNDIILDERTTAEALRCLRFHEAVLLTIARAYEVKVSRRSIQFFLTSEGKKALFERQLSMQLERNSCISTRAFLDDLVRPLLADSHRSNKSVIDCIPTGIWREVENFCLDRYFCMGRGVELNNPLFKEIQALRAYCRWFGALAIAQRAGQIGFHATEKRAQNTGLSLALLDRITEHRKHALGQDKGIYQRGTFVSLGHVSLEHAIGTARECVLPNEVYKDLTEWLQKTHFPRYLASYIDSNDYEIGQGEIKENKKDGYDCDLVLWERARGMFFFIQSKLKRDSRLATLTNELDALLKEDSIFSKGHQQIAKLRERLHEPAVLDKIRAAFPGMKINGKDLINRCHFILVHNIPEFNALVRDGIIIYEWNTFRNLLARGRMTKVRVENGTIVQGEVVEMKNTLPIENLEMILTHSFAASASKNYGSVRHDISCYAKARMSFNLPSLPIQGWRKFFNADSVVTSPLL